MGFFGGVFFVEMKDAMFIWASKEGNILLIISISVQEGWSKLLITIKITAYLSDLSYISSNQL